MQPVTIFKGFWTVKTPQQYPEYMFIFGDNDVKRGQKGQAVIRHCPNAFGIPTKKYPTNFASSFYSDDQYFENIKKIDSAINHIKNNLCHFKGIVYPEMGLGTGLAKLNICAPKTFAYLNSEINALFEYVNMFYKV